MIRAIVQLIPLEATTSARVSVVTTASAGALRYILISGVDTRVEMIQPGHTRGCHGVIRIQSHIQYYSIILILDVVSGCFVHLVNFGNGI